jgi:SAM-dependent methyltransferase
MSEESNAKSYRLLLEQYGHLLDDLALPAGTTALDAGSGVGTFTRLLHERGFRVTSLDISQTALDGIHLPITKVCSPIAEADFAPQSFEYVHSFDVLYHIMSDSEWARSVAALASWSSRYVVLHERFQRFQQWLPSKIMRMRPREHTRQILASAGFEEIASVPTYFLSKQLLTYRFSNRSPEPFYRTDRWSFDHLPGSLTHAIASHKIKVFERR